MMNRPESEVQAKISSATILFNDGAVNGTRQTTPSPAYYFLCGRENEERPLPHFHIKYLGICAPCQCRSKSRNFKRQPLDCLSEGPTYWLIGKPIKRQDVAEQPIGNGSAGRGCVKRKWSTEGKACIEASAQEASAWRLSRGSQEVKVQSAVSCVCL